MYKSSVKVGRRRKDRLHGEGLLIFYTGVGGLNRKCVKSSKFPGENSEIEASGIGLTLRCKGHDAREKRPVRARFGEPFGVDLRIGARCGASDFQLYSLSTLLSCSVLLWVMKKRAVFCALVVF